MNGHTVEPGERKQPADAVDALWHRYRGVHST